MFCSFLQYALPMGDNVLPEERLQYYKKNYPELIEKINTTYAGFLYDFHPGECMKATPEERDALFEELYNKGGLHFWLGTYQDILKNKEANNLAYVSTHNARGYLRTAADFVGVCRSSGGRRPMQESMTSAKQRSWHRKRHHIRMARNVSA